MNNTKFTEYSLIPFTFEALENGTLTFRDCKDKTNEVLYYKINNLDWVCGNRPLKLTLKAGDTVAFKGNSKKYKFASNSSTIAFTGKYVLKGNIMSLVYGDDFLTNTVIPEECFGMFAYNQTNLIDTKDLYIAASEVAKKGCYYMFKGCKNMKTAPKLLANTLGASAYCGMFWLCTSLTEAPELPAMNLGEGCYMSMFNICSSLVKAPELPATNLKHMCYETMFNKCTSLVKAQDILPAKELKSYCYREMFQNCTNLEKAPILPAEGFYPWGWCYTYMFKGCTKLNYIKAMFVSFPAGKKTWLVNWVEGVSEKGTFVRNKNSKWSVEGFRGTSGVPVNWNVEIE